MKLKNENDKKKSGRPSKLTQQIVEDAAMVFGLDGSNRDVAGYCGVDVTTVANWLDKGKQAHRGRHRDFYLAKCRGRAEGRIEDLRCLRNNIVVGLNAAVAFRRLQFRDPDRWREQPVRVHQEISGKDGAPLPTGSTEIKFVIENHDGKEIKARDAVLDALHGNGDRPDQTATT